MLLQKEAKQGKGKPGFPLCKPLCRLAVLATNLDFSGEKNPNPYCAQIRSKGSHGVSAPTALRCPKKSSRCSLARFFRPLRVLRLAASATGGARLRTPYPSPAAGEGPSGQITACSTHRLDSVTSCYRFAVTPHKMRRRHLESVSAAPYGSTFQHLLKSPIRIQPQLKRKGVLGHSPKRILVPFVRTKGTPRRRAVQAFTLR